MPDRDNLMKWYQNFKKELYEKANIDIERKEDIGRIRNYHVINWEEWNAPECELMFACIPHQGGPIRNNRRTSKV